MMRGVIAAGLKDDPSTFVKIEDSYHTIFVIPACPESLLISALCGNMVPWALGMPGQRLRIKQE